MKIVVIGGTGLIGFGLVALLRERGHEIVPASPSLGINAVTGEGIAGAVAGADVVVDVANSPSFEDEAVMKFFEASSRNLLAAETAAGVAHHVALSVVGTERLLASGYFRAKMEQERLIKASPVPFTIVRATQFFEFLGAIAQSGGDGPTVRMPVAMIQPMAASDVSAALADVALQPPSNRTLEIGGPEKFSFQEIVGRVLRANGDERPVVADAEVSYFGTAIDDKSLVPDDDAMRGATTYEEWASRNA